MARPKGGYVLKGGTPIPGTTTITGMVNKPALVGWAAKTMHARAVEYGRQQHERGAYDFELEPLEPWTEIVYGARDAAAEAGTQAHEMFEKYLRGEVVPTPHYSEEARQAYGNALHWLQASALEIEPFEKPLVSEIHGYGGTPDALARLGTQTYLADWKTGGTYAEHLLQMAAYRQLILENGIDAVCGVHLVRFSREHGDFTHHFWGPDALDQAWEIFKHLLAIYEPMKKLAKRVK